ncbi:hypothetical protein MSG28_014626 [Choristoneura fumiferana]|uniref:Uncharacterized protein n=1 Tax=Choristoneura fumiferana TaxID=7141 RepID=A0ACC0JSK8_CHOFU|nr:hypothetical protein MSG28_014626 [Choristoneura fumiferana]
MKISRTVLSECAKSRIRPAMRLKEKEITIEAPWGKIRVRLVREHYRWHKFIYIGHSLGVVLAYPGHISRMVELDPVPAHDSYRPDPAVIREWYHHFYHNYYGHEQYTKLNGGGDNAPKYSFEKALEMVMKNRSLHKEAAECILERAIAPAENGLYSPILRCAENSYFLIVLFHLPLNKGQIKTFFIVAWGSCADPPVLLCHGAVDSAASWRPIMEHLPPTFYYIGMELPGNGKSDPLPRGLMLATHDLVFTFDQRTKQVVLPPYTSEHARKFFTEMKTPTLVIIASVSLKRGAYDKVPFALDEKCHPHNNYRVFHVEGRHDVHVMHPERMAKVVERFLLYGVEGLDTKSKL